MQPSFQAEVTYDLEGFSLACQRYAAASGKSEGQVIAKQASELAWFYSGELRKMSPAKGAVRAERLAAMRSRSAGTNVRPAVILDVAQSFGALFDVETHQATLHYQRGKTFHISHTVGGLNWWALAVKRELSVRERGRGFLAHSIPHPDPETTSLDVESRYGFNLANYNLHISEDLKSATLTFKGAQSALYEGATEGLGKPKQMAALERAVELVSENVDEYVREAHQRDAEAAGFKFE